MNWIFSWTDFTESVDSVWSTKVLPPDNNRTKNWRRPEDDASDDGIIDDDDEDEGVEDEDGEWWRGRESSVKEEGASWSFLILTAEGGGTKSSEA